MRMLNSNVAILLRAIFRHTFIKKIFSIRSSNTEHEAKYIENLVQELRDEDVVWDIGANVGHFTKIFASYVGSNGKVFAFEPLFETFTELQRNVSDLKNVTCVNLALSNHVGKSHFRQGRDAFRTTSQIISTSQADSVLVETSTGDALIEQGEAPLPDFVKIDVEGHEINVLLGITKILNEYSPRIIAVEVHFEKLARSGQLFGPKWIEKRLRHNYAIKWIDASHLIAKLT